MLVAILVSLLVVAPVPAGERPHVYLVIVDGLDARFATPTHMPKLFEVLERPAAHASRLTARAVMPSRTNPNHATLLTGVFPEAHGITGNQYWSREPGDDADKLDKASLIEVQTLFTIAEASAPALVTTAVFGKAKLGRLFAAVPGRQQAADHLWSPGSEFFSMGGSGDDGTMTTALESFAKDEPDLAAVQLAEVDRHGHGYGPESPEYARAVGAADAAIRRLVDRLETTGRWHRSVLIVTADHGFSSVAPTAERPHPVIDLEAAAKAAQATGVHVVSDGPVAHVYAMALRPGATTLGDTAAALTRAAEVFSGLPGVAEVLARLPLPGVRLLAEAHPDWHLAHQRTGELFLVAARGYEFADATDLDSEQHRGNHGGPHEQTIPLFVAGGFPGLRVAPATTPPPSSAAIGRTIAVLLGLPPPKRVDGTALPALPSPVVELLPPGTSY